MEPVVEVGSKGKKKTTGNKRTVKKKNPITIQNAAFPERSVQEKEKLIAAVAKHNHLWKKDEANYMNREATKTAWDSVANDVKIPAMECRVLWKNLRDSFAAKLRKVRGGKSGDGLEDVEEGSKAKKWTYFKQMLFLEDTLAFRRTKSNMDDSDVSSDEAGEGENQDLTGDGENQDQTGERDTLNQPREGSNQDHAGERNTQDHSPHWPKGRKRPKPVNLMDRLTKHIDAVGKVLCEPAQKSGNSGNEGFMTYLGVVLNSVPPEKMRKCEQDLLMVANSYADGKEIQMVEVHPFESE